MTRSPCHPLRSEDSSLSRDLFTTQAFSPAPQPQEIDNSNGTTMPALADLFPPGISDYYHDFRHQGLETLPVPRAFPLWPGLPNSSEFYQHPRSHQNEISLSDKAFADVFGNLMGDSSVEVPSWSYEDLREPTPSLNSSIQGCRQYQFNVDNCTKSPGPNTTMLHPSHVFGYPTPPLDQSASSSKRRHNGITSAPYSNRTQSYQSCTAPEPQLIQPHVDSSSTCSTPPLQKSENASPQNPRCSAEIEGKDCSSLMNGEESDGDRSVNSEPYATLIFKALKSAPGHKMVLKEIYEWFETNTDKARNHSSKGWQNSIRHNLSMNGVRVVLFPWFSSMDMANKAQAFKKVDQIPPRDEAKKGFIWVLEPSAIKEGVKSTTRYRKSMSNKKVAKSSHPAPERQRSGVKGGKAARKALKVRRSTPFDESGPQSVQDAPMESVETLLHNNTRHPLTPTSLWTPESTNSFLATPSRSLTPMKTEQIAFSYGDIAGVTCDIPAGPLFSDEYSQNHDPPMGLHAFEHGNALTTDALCRGDQRN